MKMFVRRSTAFSVNNLYCVGKTRALNVPVLPHGGNIMLIRSFHGPVRTLDKDKEKGDGKGGGKEEGRPGVGKGKGPGDAGGWPSTTENPSGGGRSNNPPRDK
jgi:hypothetical protein